MTQAEPNPEVGPPGAEAVEFVDVPPGDLPAAPDETDEDPDRPAGPEHTDPSESLPPGTGRP